MPANPWMPEGFPMELPAGVEIADGVTLHPAPPRLVDLSPRYQLREIPLDPIPPEYEAYIQESLDRILRDPGRWFP